MPEKYQTDSSYEIDALDRKILRRLLEDARTPFLGIARDLGVSGGTIHQRVERLRDEGIITGSKITLDPRRLGYDVTVLLGIHLRSGDCLGEVIERMEALHEVTEVYYTTGSYALMIKAVTKNIEDFHRFLVTKLQVIEGIQSTESFINLNQPINRDIHV